jgi:replicative DNA helicase
MGTLSGEAVRYEHFSDSNALRAYTFDMSSASFPHSKDSRNDKFKKEAQRAELSKFFQKQPPRAIEAEMGLLGAMILDWQVIGEVIQVLSGADAFYQPAHAAIYSVLIDLYDRHEPVDMIHLKQKLEDRSELEQVGGLEYLLELAEGVPSAATARYYAKLVREASIKRQLIDAAGNILIDTYSSADNTADLLEHAEQVIFKLAESRSSVDDASDLATLLQETYDRLEAAEDSHYTGIQTGFRDLDDMTSGLQNGEMIILAARPSMGKTALALNIAEHVSANSKLPSAIFSLEMSKQQLAQRLLCSRSGVDSHKLRRNMLSGDDFASLANTVGELSDAPIFIDDTPGLALLQLRAKARRLASRYDIKLFIIDYLQLMRMEGRVESRQQEVSEMSRGIKAMAREVNAPVICLSQLNRAAEQREGHRPRMSDLRESGSIEQDADVVMMLHREEYYHVNDPEWLIQNPEKVGLSELILTKQRNGPTGSVNMQFDHKTTRFHDRAMGSGMNV